MTFENWYSSKYPYIASEEEFASLQEAWAESAKTEREMAMTAILEECPNDGSYAEIILRRAWDRVRTMRSNGQK